MVFPRLRHLYAYAAADTAPRLFTATDSLDAGTVLPGFTIPMAGLFPTIATEPKDSE